MELLSVIRALALSRPFLDPRDISTRWAVEERRGTVGFGTSGERHGRTLRREFIRPRYTTVWQELLYL